MRVVIFAGPTNSKEEILEILPGATVLGPAEQGDIDFACRVLRAKLIGLIDGVHSQKLPVLHKEILHVMQAGCRFIGAASMGALRAVECMPWGAEPVGEVASWYAKEEIDGDDEVCIAHGRGPAYRSLSLPLVNVRATLTCARIEKARYAQLVDQGKAIYYADRTWPALFKAAGCSEEEQKHILAHELDIKHADALHLCYYIGSLAGRPKAEREIKNSAQGYGGVFLRNDRKLWNGKHVFRQHELAAPSFRDAALNRILALAFCKMVGLTAEAPESEVRAADDLDEKDFKRLRDEEATLARGREWLSNTGNGFEDVSVTLDLMRVAGVYGKAKEMK